MVSFAMTLSGCANIAHRLSHKPRKSSVSGDKGFFNLEVS
jgi:hypothetical protein